MAAGSRCDEILKSLGIQMDNAPRPRAPPRFIHPPSPLVMDRPQPIVPDVSLILDSASTSMHSITSRSESPSANIHSKLSTTGNNSNEISPNMMNFMNYYPTPPQPSNGSCSSNFEVHQSLRGDRTDSGRGTSALSASSEKDDTIGDESLSSGTKNSSLGQQETSKDNVETLKSSIAMVLKIVVEQTSSISKLDAQMQQIISFQERFLSHMLSKSSGISRETQTEISSNQGKEAVAIQSPKSESLRRGTPSPKDSEPKVAGKEVLPRSHKEVSALSSTIKDTPKAVRDSRIPVSSVGGDKNTEDLSAFLRNIHVGNGHDPSLYSIKSIEVPDYHNDTFQNDSFNRSPNIGPSVSAYGSSSEDEADEAEAVKPTKTFYNNLLGTVNRILEGGNENAQKNAKSIPALNAKSTAQISRKTDLVSSPCSRGSTGSYSSDLSFTGSDRLAFRDTGREDKENFLKQPDFNARSVGDGGIKDSNNVVDVTKKYLQTLGVQFESPVPPNDQTRPPLRGMTTQQQQNYMIQQNVYNSIYIPTLNCAPVMSDSINSNSGMIDNLAHKYIPQSELNQYEMLQGRKGGSGGTETTVYGMSSNNLSFATKQYLQRYGLVNQPVATEPGPQDHYYGQTARPTVPNTQQMPSKSDRILDITAIRNQPKLL